MLSPEQNQSYQVLTDNIIKAIVKYSVPYTVFGERVYQEYNNVKIACHSDREFVTNINAEFSSFLCNIHDFTVNFIAILTHQLSEFARANTLVDGNKTKTTNALSQEILGDSFYEVSKAVNLFNYQMQRIGVEHDNISITNSALKGPAISTGIEYLVFKKAGLGGAVFGAILGAQMAFDEKQRLVQESIKTTFSSIRNVNNQLLQCNKKLIDQVSTIVYGVNIDFQLRDIEIDRGHKYIESVLAHCNNIIEQLYLSQCVLSVFVVKNNEYPGNLKNRYLTGCLPATGIYILFGILFFPIARDSLTANLFVLIICGLITFFLPNYIKKSKGGWFRKRHNTRLLKYIDTENNDQIISNLGRFVTSMKSIQNKVLF